MSPTKADIALDDGDTTLTVVVSPMSGSGANSAIGAAFLGPSGAKITAKPKSHRRSA